MNLPAPTNQLQKVLLALIEYNDGVSEKDYRINGFRSRISDLRKWLNIKHTVIPFTNEFGRSGTYRRHWIMNDEKQKAIDLYLKLRE